MSKNASKDEQLTPVGRYSKLSKPENFDEDFQLINKSRVYNSDHSLYILPTDRKSSNEYELSVDEESFIFHAQQHRKALSMTITDPIYVLRSSLPLRELYTISTQFATNPMTFIQTPIESAVPIEQQLFEDRLMYIATTAHPFLTLIYSSATREFFLFFNIPIPLETAGLQRPESFTEEEFKSTPGTLLYIGFVHEALAELTPVWPKAERPIVVTNTFAECTKTNPHKEDQGISHCECANARCPYSVREALFQCSSCKLVKYCSQECQRSDWPRHKRFCKISTSLKAGKYPDPIMPLITQEAPTAAPKTETPTPAPASNQEGIIKLNLDD
ncbi:hypothetical protein BLNAU_7899 [Blattamonas nauphoetae]|uniref:MYND-type domain-containing protein n=1 Tax=Blattamonas nauphoetae TaxID=2049346 RepID=A0ABQ9Y058_9EUKA|nr:hypothetical protein BLNAU_7899 [Blattamonas nauphoetae]